MVVTTPITRMTELGSFSVDVPFWHCPDCDLSQVIYSDEEMDKQFDRAVQKAKVEATRLINS